MSDRLKYRVWDNERNKYHNTDDVIDNNGILGCVAWTVGFVRYKDGLCVIEQCTGLKDKNGKLIYEGDIFKAEVINSFDEDEYLYKIIYGQVSWFDIEGCFAFARYQPSDLFEIEIIGNIHENKELLGEE